MEQLIEFTVGNFLSFRDKNTLSMIASRIRECPQNIQLNKDQKILKSAVIYGANSSGKSNLISAISFFKSTILSSNTLNSEDEFELTPFKLNLDSRNEPSFFEVMFLENDYVYRYGIEITDNEVISEWFFFRNINSTNEKPLFAREGKTFEISEGFAEGEGLDVKTRDNGFFISVCDQFNGEKSHHVIKFLSNLRVFSGIDHKGLGLTLKNNWPGENDDFIKLLKGFDLGFKSINIYDKIDLRKLSVRNPLRPKVYSNHNIYDQEGNIIGTEQFEAYESESSGTLKILEFVGLIYYSLKNGSPLIIDELDAKLHPLLTKKIIMLYNSENNNKGAQLIFSTHDTNLLSCDVFRRDQVWFVEKDRTESSSLYSLAEFKIRNDRNFEKDYIQGRFGAIPFIGNYNGLTNYGEE